MAIRVDTTQYEWTHGTKPRTPAGEASGSWAFQVDDIRTPVLLVGRYSDVVKQAKKLAQYLVTVLP